MSPALPTTPLEKTSLEAHVDLCALRYKQLDERLNNLDNRMQRIHEDVLQGQKSLNKVIITTAGTIIVGLITAVSTIIIKIQ